MQVVCGNCQLSFQAPDGATGLICPICRSPLRASDAAAEPEAGPTRQIVDWSGGSLDDLVSLLSAPAWSARVEVLPPGGGSPAGEVHVIAGGVSEAIYDGKSTHDALDRLRAVKGAKFRVEARLPNPTDGDLTFPGPDQGKLEERPLATLMRYCEDYVLTSGIEVWRGTENAKVEYRRGEIVGVTVGGIDAPERLAEVMKWSSGNYRLIVPKLTLPETAPKAPVAAAAPAAVVAPRATGATSRTIFGMPALDPAAMAASDKAKATQAPQPMRAAPGLAPAAASAAAPEITSTGARTGAAPPAAAPAMTAAPSVASAAPAPAATTVSAATAAVSAAAAAAKSAPARTIFGVQPPSVTAPAASAPTATPAAAAAAPLPAAASAAAAPAAAPAPTAAPAPSVSPAPAAVATTSRAAAAVAAPVVAPARAAAPVSPASTEVQKPAQPGASLARTQTATSKPAAAELERAAATKAAKQRPAETPVWTYVGVGFIFGMALLGVYRLVMVLAH